MNDDPDKLDAIHHEIKGVRTRLERLGEDMDMDHHEHKHGIRALRLAVFRHVQEFLAYLKGQR